MVVQLIYWKGVLEEIFRSPEDAKNYIEKQPDPENYTIEQWVVK